MSFDTSYPQRRPSSRTEGGGSSEVWSASFRARRTPSLSNCLSVFLARSEGEMMLGVSCCVPLVSSARLVRKCNRDMFR